jgi:hypothetical protein
MGTDMMAGCQSDDDIIITRRQQRYFDWNALPHVAKAGGHFDAG